MPTFTFSKCGGTDFFQVLTEGMTALRTYFLLSKMCALSSVSFEITHIFPLMWVFHSAWSSGCIQQLAVFASRKWIPICFNVWQYQLLTARQIRRCVCGHNSTLWWSLPFTSTFFLCLSGMKMFHFFRVAHRRLFSVL